MLKILTMLFISICMISCDSGVNQKTDRINQSTTSEAEPKSILGHEDIVNDISNLVFHIDTDMNGTVSIFSTSIDCMKFKYKGSFEASGPYKGSDNIYIHHLGFYEGVKHKLEGKVCLPVDARAVFVDGKYNSGIVIKNGERMYGGTAETSGQIIVENGLVLEVNSNKDNPLVFMVTKDGYRYESGTGSVKTLGGLIREFGR